ncbi:MAG: hypothetical protein HYV19_13080 [Gemmatimonadetes bacterium]|nr:hypothetical protein [Gemmatimonadota bacterium]
MSATRRRVAGTIVVLQFADAPARARAIEPTDCALRPARLVKNAAPNHSVSEAAP